MNFNFYYLVSIFFLGIQTCFFVGIYLKYRDQKQKWDKEFADIDESEVDTYTFLVYNSKAYWMEENSVVRAKYKDKKVFMSTKEKVNPLEIKDMDISEYMNILSKLEKD